MKQILYILIQILQAGQAKPVTIIREYSHFDLANAWMGRLIFIEWRPRNQQES